MSDAHAGLEFHKVSGAGNDFLVLDCRDASPPESPDRVARALCRRGTSVGADGVVVLTGDDNGRAAARMRLWNADGSAAEFSGNAARCAARFLSVVDGLEGALRLQTDIGLVEAEVAGREVRVAIPGVAEVWPQRRLRVEGRDLIGTYVRVGVPFFVLLHENPDELPVRYLGRAIRRHKDLEPAGANVDFVRIEEQGLYFRVYERGVENETLSSGTGSISAALAAAVAEQAGSPVACRARGGTLTVAFAAIPDAAADAGPAPADDTAPADELPAVASGAPLLFGGITVSGDTRYVMRGRALDEALRER